MEEKDEKTENLREIVVKLRDIYNILQSRKNDKLANYNKGEKIHKKQLAFHQCQKKNRWVFGGNRTGKTECGAVECVWLARGIHPYRTNKKDCCGWVVSVSQQVQRDVAQKKILSYIRPEWIVDIVMLSGRKDFAEGGVIDFIKIKNVFGGESVIGFKSCDQGREKFQGASLDYVWFDEEPSKDIYLECKMRVMDRCGEIFATMTPLKNLSWVYDEIFMNRNGDDEVWYEQMQWEDNPFLDAKEVEYFEKSMSADDLESRKYGHFVGACGLVYKDFDQNVNVIEPFDVPKEWFDTMSIDPGLNNPLSCHWYAVDYDGNVFVVAEHFEAGKDIDYHAQKIKEICERLGWKKNSFGSYDALIDSASGQRTLNGTKSVAELFLERGINVNTKVNKDLFSGIAQVKSYVRNAQGISRLFIFSTCKNMIEEFKGYFWGAGDVPVKKDDHCLDELRYYLMSKPRKPEPIKNKVQLHKEFLARKIAKRRRNE